MSSVHKNYLFTSESVTEGHPDKIADQISDAVLDALIKERLGKKVVGFGAGDGAASGVALAGTKVVVGKSGAVAALVGADGTAASFETLRRFRRLLATVTVAGAVAGAGSSTKQIRLGTAVSPEAIFVTDFLQMAPIWRSRLCWSAWPMCCRGRSTLRVPPLLE